MRCVVVLFFFVLHACALAVWPAAPGLANALRRRTPCRCLTPPPPPTPPSFRSCIRPRRAAAPFATASPSAAAPRQARRAALQGAHWGRAPRTLATEASAALPPPHTPPDPPSNTHTQKRAKNYPDLKQALVATEIGTTRDAETVDAVFDRVQRLTGSSRRCVSICIRPGRRRGRRSP